MTFWHDFETVLNSPGWGALEAVGTATAVGVAAWAARQANGAAFKVSAIESQRRKSELTPWLRVTCQPLNSGNDDILRLSVALVGPPGLDRLDELTVSIRNDHFTRGEGYQEHMGGPTGEEIKAHIWGPFRFTPGTGPDEARADRTGRTTAYEGVLPIGEELPYQLEHTHPGRWMTGMSPSDWLRQQGSVIRLAFTAEHEEHGTWYLPCEVDTATMPATAFVPQTTGTNAG